MNSVTIFFLGLFLHFASLGWWLWAGFFLGCLGCLSHLLVLWAITWLISGDRFAEHCCWSDEPGETLLNAGRMHQVGLQEVSRALHLCIRVP